MMTLNFRGPFRVRLDRNKPYPEIKHSEDAIARVLRSCICGSDLQCGLYRDCGGKVCPVIWSRQRSNWFKRHHTPF